MKLERLTGFLSRLYDRREENTIPIRKPYVSLWVGLVLFVLATAAILWLLFSFGTENPPIKKDPGQAASIEIERPAADREIWLVKNDPEDTGFFIEYPGYPPHPEL